VSAELKATALAVLARMQADIRMDGRHRYWIGKQNMPAVTAIIRNLHKEALIAWAAKVQQEADLEVAREVAPTEDLEAAFASVAHAWRRERDTAGDLGKEVHALIEAECKRRLDLQHESPHVSDRARMVYQGWEEWADSHGLEPIAIEQRLSHPGNRYCGTLDLLCFLHKYAPGDLLVLDWKTSRGKGTYPEDELQNIAYRRALGAQDQRLSGVRGMVVKLPKEGPDYSIQAHEVEDSEQAYWAFLGLLSVHRWLQGRPKK